MEDDQENEHEEDGDMEIDADLWLHVLLAISGDKERWASMVSKTSEKTGLPPEKVELILNETMKYLANFSRSN
jgi:hypothetical protein